MIKSVQAFETSDGKLFRDKDEAEKHESTMVTNKCYCNDSVFRNRYDEYRYALITASGNHALSLDYL